MRAKSVLADVFQLDALLADAARVAKGRRLSRRAMADEIGLGHQTLMYLLKGRSLEPTLNVVVRIADWAGLPLDDYRVDVIGRLWQTRVLTFPQEEQ